MALACRDTWPCNCKQTSPLGFPINLTIFFSASRSPASGGPHDPQSAFELTRMALLKMCGATAPPGLPSLPPLPGLPAEILQQAQQQQDKALNLHLQRQKAIEAEIRADKEDRLRSEDLDDVEEEEAKKSTDDAASSGVHNENSLSPPPPAIGTPASTPAVSAGNQLTSPVANGKKRHRSNDSEEIEEMSSPKKPHQNANPLGIPGVNFKIANRGNYPI